MYKVLNIGGKNYKLEYTMEAALLGECTAEVTHFIEKTAEVSLEVDKNTPIDQLEGILRDKLSKYIKTISDIPQRVLTLFYAGLLEYHGTHSEGDGSIPDLQTAKNVLAQYLREHKDEESGSFLGMMNLIIAQMEEDGFFDLIGLDKAFRIMEDAETKEQAQQPQDHKKKITKISEKQ